MRCTSAQDQWLRWQDVDRDHLRSVQKEVEDPLAHMGINGEKNEKMKKMRKTTTKLAVFVEEFERNDSIATQNCNQ